MEKLSFQNEFNRYADVVRYGNADDVKINYGVIVGADGNFLDNEIVESMNFTTWGDAWNAKDFAESVLLVVDSHMQKKFAASEITNDEIFQCVSNSVNNLLDCRNHKRFGDMLIAELTCNLNALIGKKRLRGI